MSVVTGLGNVLILSSLTVFFCMIVIGFLKMYSGIAKRSGGFLAASSADSPVIRIVQIADAVSLVITIGFGGGLPLDCDPDTDQRDLRREK